MPTQSEPEDLYQIALLIDQLKHDDLQFRITASKSMCKIANCLGPERTREELLPFIGESNDDDDDEVLQIIAEKLGELVEYVGGKEYAYILLEPLESLASVEEPKVREAVILSIKNVSDKMPNDHLKKFYVPLVTRLAKRDCFTSRMSAVSLFHTCYEKLAEDDKSLMRLLFLKLCSDDTPSVDEVRPSSLS
jgi:serine/threonine-protein phosphatase 2A regulatory subunit A